MKKNQIRGKSKRRNFIISIIFWLHLPIGIIWLFTFLIPLSLWPSRISFHFWYISLLLLAQLIWGIVLYPKTKKLDFICPLTTLMQSLRGYPIESKKNYSHSFIAELFERLKIKVSFLWVDILLFITFITVSMQYFWLPGIK